MNEPRYNTRRLDPERRKDGALKELAGRLNRLSYRDMLRFSEEVVEKLPGTGHAVNDLADAVLLWADKMGGEA